MMNPGKRLYLLRQLAGLSQRELAKRAGVTNSVISTLEQGKVSPSVTSIEKIIKPLNLSLEHFFSFSEVGTAGVPHQQAGLGNVLPLELLPGDIHIKKLNHQGLLVVTTGVIHLQLLEECLTLTLGQWVSLAEDQLFSVNTDSARATCLLIQEK